MAATPEVSFLSAIIALYPGGDVLRITIGGGDFHLGEEGLARSARRVLLRVAVVSRRPSVCLLHCNIKRGDLLFFNEVTKVLGKRSKELA